MRKRSREPTGTGSTFPPENTALYVRKYLRRKEEAKTNNRVSLLYDCQGKEKSLFCSRDIGSGALNSYALGYFGRVDIY
uniref:Uncharacterized protein n=1 Tax=Anguilla anguilla TaxID=7936 RepID=A0A0E9SGN4_ANGAN